MPTDDTYTIGSGAELWAGRNIPVPLVLPDIGSPTNSSDGGTPYRHFAGSWDIDARPYYTEAGADLPGGYSARPTFANGGRLHVFLHGSGSGTTSINNAYAPDAGFDVEYRQADAETISASWREWHTAGTDGVNYPGRRIVDGIRWLMQRYPAIDVTTEGIAIMGNSLGMGGAIMQTMILPDPWRARLAFVSGDIGATLPRIQGTTKYTNWLADSGDGMAFWDGIDFSIQCLTDPIVRGMHYRHRFSSNDSNYSDSGTSTQLPWVNLCETNKISLVAVWVNNGHQATEAGITFRDIRSFEGESNCTIDKAHPCFTNSSGNYPTAQADRLDVATYPRGHYNLGLIWDHDNVVDSASEIIFPLRYSRATSMGGSIPDQPTDITVDVTPRRPKNFTLTNGETIFWSFDSGAQTGSGTVSGDVFTASSIALTSGGAFKNLRFYKA